MAIPGVRDDADDRKKAMRVGIILKNLANKAQWLKPEIRVSRTFADFGGLKPGKSQASVAAPGAAFRGVEHHTT